MTCFGDKVKLVGVIAQRVSDEVVVGVGGDQRRDVSSGHLTLGNRQHVVRHRRSPRTDELGRRLVAVADRYHQRSYASTSRKHEKSGCRNYELV